MLDRVELKLATELGDADPLFGIRRAIVLAAVAIFARSGPCPRIELLHQHVRRGCQADLPDGFQVDDQL
jgi:hypothetical protein